MKIYVASSWRNSQQEDVVSQLRASGHEVYDFKNPPNRAGFQWSTCDPNWQSWNNEQYRKMLNHPIAEEGYDSDFTAMEWAEVCVLVLPCGRSAHAEAGWFSGAGKPVVALLAECEPELMYKMFTRLCIDIKEVIQALELLQIDAENIEM